MLWMWIVQEAHVSEHLVPAGGTILGYYRNLGGGALLEEVGH